MGKIDRSFVYKRFKNILIKNYDKNIADSIWEEADVNLKRLLKKYNYISFDEKMMVLPLAAIYEALKKYDDEHALDLLIQYGKQRGNDFSTMIAKVTSFPGLSIMLGKNMPQLMRLTSSPKKGYERRIVSESRELVGVDILVCPLYEMAKKLGMPEIASVVCLIDKGQMTGFKYIDYTRTKALGNGDDCCDYRLRFDKSKK